MLDLLKGLDRDRFEAFVLFPKEGPLRRIVASIGWESLIFNMPWWIACNQRSRWHFRKVFGGLWQRVMFLRKLIREEGIGLVYTNTITCIDAAIAARLTGVAHVWHIHEIFSGHTGLKIYMPSFFMPTVIGMLSDKVIVPSNSVRKEIEGRLSKHKIQLINNGVDLRRFNFINSTDVAKGIRDELCIPKSTRIIALIGTFLEIKGQADFIEAAKIVSNNIHDTVFVLVGKGGKAYTDVIKKKVKKLELDDKIYFMGFREDIDRVICSLDILISASWIESFSRVILEGMAMEKPVVATECGGPEEIVVDGETGFLVPIKNPYSLADAIIQLLTDENKAIEMGRKGRQRVEELFTVKKYVKNIENVIAELC